MLSTNIHLVFLQLPVESRIDTENQLSLSTRSRSLRAVHNLSRMHPCPIIHICYTPTICNVASVSVRRLAKNLQTHPHI